MIDSRHELIKGIPDPMRKIIRHHLRMFREQKPRDFDLRGASIGNLILTSGYLENERHLDPVIYIFSHLVRVRGRGQTRHQSGSPSGGTPGKR